MWPSLLKLLKVIWTALKVPSKAAKPWENLANHLPPNFLLKKTTPKSSIQVLSSKMTILKFQIVGTFSIKFEFTETIEKVTPECQQNDTVTENPVATTEKTPITTMVPLTISNPIISGSFLYFKFRLLIVSDENVSRIWLFQFGCLLDRFDHSYY